MLSRVRKEIPSLSYQSNILMWGMILQQHGTGLVQLVTVFRTDSGLILHLWNDLVRVLNFVFLFTNIYSSLFWGFWILLLSHSCLVSLTVCILPFLLLVRILNHISPMVDQFIHLSFNSSFHKNCNHWKIAFSGIF